MKKSKKEPANAIFYGNYKEMIYNATPEQVKAIMVAFCEYAFDNKTPTIPPEIALVWGVIKGNIDDDRKQYIARCEQNRENALKRYGKESPEELCSVIYNSNGEEYEIIYPQENECNIVGLDRFIDLFGEIEEQGDRLDYYLSRFVKMGNKDKWEQSYETYEQAIWEEIYRGTV